MSVTILEASTCVIRDTASKKGRTLAFVASVCGTDEDPQGLERQESALRAAGVLLADSDARAVALAAAIARRLK